MKTLFKYCILSAVFCSSLAFAGTYKQKIELTIIGIADDPFSVCKNTGFRTTDIGSERWGSSSSCSASDDYRFGNKNWYLITRNDGKEDYLGNCESYFTRGANSTPEEDGTLYLKVEGRYGADGLLTYSNCTSRWKAD